MSDVAAPVAAASARDQLRRLSVLIATCFVDMIGFAMVLPILPFYALDLKALSLRGRAHHGRFLRRAAPVGALCGDGSRTGTDAGPRS